LTGSIEVVNEGSAYQIKYGALYNWYAASKNGGTGNGSIAPSGWHVPSVAEWGILATELGGDLIAGDKLKEIGFTYWDEYNTGTNEYGFNARGSGLRNYEGLFSIMLGAFAVYCCDSNDLVIGYSVEIDSDMPKLLIGSTITNINGYGIRLIKGTSDWTEGETVTDIDGNVYGTTKIGNQVWINSNLAVTHFNDGTPIPNVTDNSAWVALTTEAYCWYDNDINNGFITD